MSRSGFTPSNVSVAAVAGSGLSAKRVPFVISTADDLRALTLSPKVFRRLPPNGFVVAFPGVDKRAQQAFRREIERYARACGCGAGAATFLLCAASLAVSVILLMRSHQAWTSVIEVIVVGIFLVLLLTAASKALSISLAGWRFRRRCTQMLDTLLATPL
ncbi:hypothetical protein [Paraburkholderia atlantica]|uniref:hypothetical protein n=1 Tax=Paraburkholderia atlantica TaxID=2654982 RepID=UPI00160A8B69|nr:hypothetical protein [Paraburkholderia atlantica]MBB5421751.1 hypothetical protein [Paraburkholderia atlantica]